MLSSDLCGYLRREHLNGVERFIAVKDGTAKLLFPVVVYPFLGGMTCIEAC